MIIITNRNLYHKLCHTRPHKRATAAHKQQVCALEKMFIGILMLNICHYYELKMFDLGVDYSSYGV